MTQKEKIELLKDTITYLYEKEGRSKKYISEVLKVDRKTLIYYITEWELIQATKRHLTPSNEKFLNKYKQHILDMLDSDNSLKVIANDLKISYDKLYHTFIINDKDLLTAHHKYIARQKLRVTQKRLEKQETQMNQSSFHYITEKDFIQGEIWEDILGYPTYQVSNMGRIKRYAKRYNKYYLIFPSANTKNKRIYVSLCKDNKAHNLMLSRLVAHHFVQGYSDINNTVDHIDGDIANNKADNLEWVSQQENNQRAYDNGKPGHKSFSKNGKFKKIILDDRYEFSTIKALSKFMGKPETQTQRYIDGSCNNNHKFSFIY